MNYKWDINKLNFYYYLSKILGNKSHARIIKEQISLISADSSDVSKELLDGVICDLTLEDVKRIYFTGLHRIPDELYDSLTDMFTWFQDLNVFDDGYTFKELNISDNDLIDICLEIISSLKNADMIDKFKVVASKKSKILHMENSGKYEKSIINKVGGITFLNPYSKYSNILVFRDNTIEDIEYLVHEFMHFYFNYITTNKHEEYPILSELEGQFGSVYTSRYLDKYFKDEAFILRRRQNNSILTSSYLLMVSHSLILTSDEDNFNKKKAEELLNEYISEFKVTIRDDELDTYLSTPGFETITNIICYLIILEIINKDNVIDIIKSLKEKDNMNILSLLDKFNINFHRDEYKNLIKEYKITHNNS